MLEDALSGANKNILQLKKERDFHKLAHRGIKTENSELMSTIDRIQDQHDDIIKENKTLRKRYEVTKRKSTVADIKLEKTQQELLKVTMRQTSISDDGEPNKTTEVPKTLSETARPSAMSSSQLLPSTLLPRDVAGENVIPMTITRAKELRALTAFQAHDSAVSSMVRMSKDGFTPANLRFEYRLSIHFPVSHLAFWQRGVTMDHSAFGTLAVTIMARCFSIHKLTIIGLGVW